MNDEWLDLEVTKICELTSAIKEFELQAVSNGALPVFSAGAHLKFSLPLPTGPTERCYSLINATEQNASYRIAVHRAPNSKGGSAYMHEKVLVGTRLRTRMPRNDFPLSKGGMHHILLAGGIGVTPILAMAKALTVAGQSFEMHYVARTAETMAYREEIGRAFPGCAQLYWDHGDPSRGIPLQQILARPEHGKHVYVCGPQAMLDNTLAIASAQGWNKDCIHFELFSAPVIHTDAAAIEVRLSRAAATHQVPTGKSILDVLLEQGYDLLYDCKRGECGICAVAVLEGEAEHHDYVLSEAQKQEDKLMCICVSRARTKKLVLDI